VLTESVAAGVYLGEVLIAPELGASLAAGDQAGASVLRARAKVFATGAHDGVLAVPNNDLPGIFSARALCQLIARGVGVEGPIALAGEGFWADELARLLGDRVAVRVPASELLRIKGSGRVKGVSVKSGSKTRSIEVDTVAFEAPASPSFEVAAQAGASVRYAPRIGYEVEVDERGRAGDGVWALGECTGRAFHPEAFESDAAMIAEDVVQWLRASVSP